MLLAHGPSFSPQFCVEVSLVSLFFWQHTSPSASTPPRPHPHAPPPDPPPLPSPLLLPLFSLSSSLRRACISTQMVPPKHEQQKTPPLKHHDYNRVSYQGYVCYKTVLPTLWPYKSTTPSTSYGSVIRRLSHKSIAPRVSCQDFCTTLSLQACLTGVLYEEYDIDTKDVSPRIVVSETPYFLSLTENCYIICVVGPPSTGGSGVF